MERDRQMYYKHKEQIKDIKDHMNNLKSKASGEYHMLAIKKILLVREIIKGGTTEGLIKAQHLPDGIKLDNKQIKSIQELVEKRQDDKLSLPKAILLQKKWFREIKYKRLSKFSSRNNVFKTVSTRNNRRPRIFKTGKSTIYNKLSRDIRSSKITEWHNTRLEYIVVCLNTLIDFLNKFTEETMSHEIKITIQTKIKGGKSVKIPNIFETNYNLFLEKTIRHMYDVALNMFNNYLSSGAHGVKDVVDHFTSLLLLVKKFYKERLYSDFELLESITTMLLGDNDERKFRINAKTLRSFLESSKWETGRVFALTIDWGLMDEHVNAKKEFWYEFDSKLIQMLFFLKDSNHEIRKRILRSLKSLHLMCLERLNIWDGIYDMNAEEGKQDLIKRPIIIAGDPTFISDFIYHYKDASCPSVQKRALKDYEDYYSEERTLIRKDFKEISSRMNHALGYGNNKQASHLFENFYEHLTNNLGNLFTKDLLLFKAMETWKSYLDIISVSPADMVLAGDLKNQIDKLSSKILDEPKLEFRVRGDLYRMIIKSAKKEPIFDGRMMNILRDYHAYVASKKLGLNMDTFKRFTRWTERQNK